jgi:hypothetical protein
MIGLINRKINTTVGGGGKWIGRGPNGPSGTTSIC